MKATQRQMNEINRVEREIKRTKSWKRKNDLNKYLAKLKKELTIYLRYRNEGL